MDSDNPGSDMHESVKVMAFCLERNLWGWRGWAIEGCVPRCEAKKAFQPNGLLRWLCYDVRIDSASEWSLRRKRKVFSGAFWAQYRVNWKSLKKGKKKTILKSLNHLSYTYYVLISLPEIQGPTAVHSRQCQGPTTIRDNEMIGQFVSPLLSLWTPTWICWY